MFTELKNARQFCEVLRTRAAHAREEGEITAREYRLIGLFSRIRPRATRDVMEFVLERAVEVGRVAAGEDVEAIDWERLADFIQRIMPVILAFIQALMLFF